MRTYREIMADFDSNKKTLSETLDELESWRHDGDWVPANGGYEEPFMSRAGVRLLYCYQARSGRHAYLNMQTDIILTDDEANSLMFPELCK